MLLNSSDGAMLTLLLSLVLPRTQPPVSSKPILYIVQAMSSSSSGDCNTVGYLVSMSASQQASAATAKTSQQRTSAQAGLTLPKLCASPTPPRTSVAPGHSVSPMSTGENFALDWSLSPKSPVDNSSQSTTPTPAGTTSSNTDLVTVTESTLPCISGQPELTLYLINPCTLRVSGTNEPGKWRQISSMF